MVAHAEIPVIRHLIGQIYIAVTQSTLRKIRFFKLVAIDIDNSVFVYIDPLSGACDHTLDQELVSLPERYNISCLQSVIFYRNYNLTRFQSR